jgi:hypothetical protein
MIRPNKQSVDRSSSDLRKESKARIGKKRGGFGGTRELPISNDYAIFPALEKHILDTLIPVAPDGSTTITNEIYQRLDQIYGFPQFNFEYNENQEDESQSGFMSLEEMISLSADSDDDADESATSPRQNSVQESDSLLDLSMHLSKLPAFPRLRVLHIDPLVLAVDEFFTEQECDNYVERARTNNSSKKNEKSNKNLDVMQSRSPTVGKDAAAKAQRTSTTFYNTYKSVPELMSKACRLLGINSIDRFEEPQIVRYRRSEQFTWHLDALGPRELSQGQQKSGQRIATLLVYLTDLTSKEGGATLFRDLGMKNSSDKYLRVQPRKGSALLFFPAAGGILNAPLDIRTLHSGEMVSPDSNQDKWIAQLWLREFHYPPTAPPGNTHAAATLAIAEYCKKQL